MAVSKRSGIFYSIAAVSLLIYAILFFQNNHAWGGWLLLIFLIALAIAFRRSTFLKGLSFTMMIFAVVSVAMYHPEYFKTAGDFKFSALIIPLLQIIMFGMGTELSLKDFANVIKMPRGIFVGVAGHYIIM